MTDLPEKLWLDVTSEDDDGFFVVEAEKRHGNMDTYYIREDLALAMVAAERERCARVVETTSFSRDEYDKAMILGGGGIRRLFAGAIRRGDDE